MLVALIGLLIAAALPITSVISSSVAVAWLIAGIIGGVTGVGMAFDILQTFFQGATLRGSGRLAQRHVFGVPGRVCQPEASGVAVRRGGIQGQVS